MDPKELQSKLDALMRSKSGLGDLAKSMGLSEDDLKMAEQLLGGGGA